MTMQVNQERCNGCGDCVSICPSSFVCPIAVMLAIDIKKTVAEVPGVTSQDIAIEGYLMAEELEKLINQEA